MLGYQGPHNLWNTCIIIPCQIQAAAWSIKHAHISLSSHYVAFVKAYYTLPAYHYHLITWWPGLLRSKVIYLGWSSNLFRCPPGWHIFCFNHLREFVMRWTATTWEWDSWFFNTGELRKQGHIFPGTIDLDFSQDGLDIDRGNFLQLSRCEYWINGV